MKIKKLIAVLCAVIMTVSISVCVVGCDDLFAATSTSVSSVSGSSVSNSSADTDSTTKSTYQVTIVNGEDKTTETYEEGEEVVLKELKKDGFEFLGYYVDGTKVESPYIVKSDVVLTAVYQYGTLAENLLNALKTYLQSTTFQSSISNAKTAAAWLPLSYLRYVEGNFYTDDNAFVFKKYINMLPELVENGEIKDSKWAGSSAQAQGWYGITDYLYTYAIAMNGYKEYLHSKGLQDNSMDIYNNAISAYLEHICLWMSKNQTKYPYNGGEITQANLNNTWMNVWRNVNSYGYDGCYTKMTPENLQVLLGHIATATGSDVGHAEFLEKYKGLAPLVQAYTDEKTRIAPLEQEIKDKYKNGEYADYSAYMAALNEVRVTLKDLQTNCKNYCTDNKIDKNSLSGFLPNTQVAFGMSATAYLAIIKANLGLEADISYVDKHLMSYYEKDEAGNFVKTGGTPNWVGPTGRPIAASLYRNKEGYDVNFEKCRQGYFPFTDGWNQPLEEMITLDLYGKYYDHTLTTGANVTPQWGLLTGYMHGIDMENYKVSKPVEGEPDMYNIITLWRNNLKVDEQNNYVISGNIDMAVAICYLAYINGIEAPTPLGMYDSADKVIKL